MQRAPQHLVVPVDGAGMGRSQGSAGPIVLEEKKADVAWPERL